MKLKLKNLILNLIQKYFLKVDSNILPGDIICHELVESVHFEAVGIYYNYRLEPILFAKDINGPVTYIGKLSDYKRATVFIGEITF